MAPGTERFDDLLLGSQEQTPASQCGDLLLRDRDGNWTYQFAVTVDDYGQAVNLVIRGADLLSSTGRQLRLARMLGRVEMPLFLHHPLIEKKPGEKLSKSDGDTGVRDLRRLGLPPSEVIGRAAAAVGLVETMRPIEAEDVAELFQSPEEAEYVMADPQVRLGSESQAGAPPDAPASGVNRTIRDRCCAGRTVHPVSARGIPPAPAG